MGSKDKVVGRLEVPMKAPGVYEGEDDDLDELVEILTGTGLEDERLGTVAELVELIRDSSLGKKMLGKPIIADFLARWNTNKKGH